jgi:hypothetical protein
LCLKSDMALRSINIAGPMADASLSLLGLGDEDNSRRTGEELPPEDECWRPYKAGSRRIWLARQR